MLVALFIPACVISLALHVFRWRRSIPDNVAVSGNSARIRRLYKLRDRHEIISTLAELIERDGAGTWPPKANHTQWPLALRPYKDIYLELNSLLPTAQVSLDGEINRERCTNYRSLMRKLLAERIDTRAVETLLSAVAAGDERALPYNQYNGVYCCVAVLRHAYRWATIPIVKIAQLEKTVDFPPALDVPWPYLQARFGLEADSGNNTANVLHNFDEQGERVYKINVGMSDVIRTSEEVFFRMFRDVEIMAFPVYYHMVMAVTSFQDHNKRTCTHHMRKVTSGVRDVLLVFYENLTKERVSHSIWLSYIQGFQGWGIGRVINGEYVIFDGLSGNHVLFFQALDAFLGIEPYLTDENMRRYIPVNQRRLSAAFRNHSFRNQLNSPGDEAIQDEFTKIVNYLKVFRTAHRARVIPYLGQPAPERLPMTAGKSILEGKDAEGALKVLDDMLVERLRQTT